MRRAICEDDNDIGLLGGTFTRDEDLWGNHFRASAHFYDPINNAGYAYSAQCTLFDCVLSTEWALGRTGLLAGAGVLQSNRRNHFTWQDARNHYWWALTLSKAGSVPTALNRERNSYERHVRLATTIKSIGHVIHLLQDTAQPQHTRNDAHGPPYLAPLSAVDGLYEQYTEARVFGGELSGESFAFYDDSLPPIDLVPPIRLSGNQPYAILRFRLPAFYFTTQAVDSGVAARRGLADYSNRGYFTLGTFPKTGQYLSPPRPSVSLGAADCFLEI